MKAITPAVCATSGASVVGGRVARPRRDVENEEIQMYLSKLKELVPFMPKNRRLSKLEVIQHVIDYICDLQYALESHPNINTAAAAAAAVAATTRATTVPVSTPIAGAAATSPRQPLGVLATNALAAACAPEHLPTVSCISKMFNQHTSNKPPFHLAFTNLCQVY